MAAVLGPSNGHAGSGDDLQSFETSGTVKMRVTLLALNAAWGGNRNDLPAGGITAAARGHNATGGRKYQLALIAAWKGDGDNLPA